MEHKASFTTTLSGMRLLKVAPFAKERGQEMARLKIEKFGDSAEGIRLIGDRNKPEPEHVRIVFPGGHVEVTRAIDGINNPPYWVHVFVNKVEANNYDPTEPTAQIVSARLDQIDRHAGQEDLGDFNRSELYHLAVRVERTGKAATDKC